MFETVELGVLTKLEGTGIENIDHKNAAKACDD